MPMPWEKDYGEAEKPASAMPWEKDYGGKEEDFFHPVKPAAGSGWRGALERIGQYPRIFLGDILDAGDTLGKVSRGELDAAHPDAIKAASTIAQVGGPAGEFAGTGAQVARRAGLGKVANPGDANPALVAPTPGMQAAQTAIDVGQPLPAGIVSETPGVKAFTQGFRQAPLVGPRITEGVQDTVRATGRKVNDIAEELGGGTIPERPTAGDATRQSLQQVIADNNDRMSDLYADLRQNHIEAHKFGSPQNTKAILDDIIAKRKSARWSNPEAGLDDIINIIRGGKGGTYGGGISFDGLQRVRSDVGSQLTTAKYNPNPGFNVGDMKKIYGAMSRDMENMVRRNVRTGSTPNDASTALRAANSNAKELIERNGRLQALIGKDRSGENIVGGIINATRNKTGNARVLGELRSQMPVDDFNKIVSIGLHELGHTPDGFSLARFAKGWSDMNPVVKNILVQDSGHRKSLDDIANLGAFLKDADKYRNTSNTAHAGGVMGLLMTAAEVAHDPEKIPAVFGAAAGGYGLSRILGRPASASALRKWLTVQKDRASGRYGPARSAVATAATSIATRNLLNNLPEEAKSEPQKAQTRAPSSGAYLPPLRP